MDRMETVEGPNNVIAAAIGAAAAADVNPSHHEETEQLPHDTNDVINDDDDDDEDRRTRIMELAQQQQMAIQLLDEVVANQRTLQENNRLIRRRRRRRQRDNNDDGLMGHHQEEEEEYPLLEEVEEPPSANNDDDTSRRQQQHHPPIHHHHHMHRHRREGGNLFTATQIYFIVSVLFAFLAVVTSPSTGMMGSNSVPPLLAKLQYSSYTNVQNHAAAVSSGGSNNGGDAVETSGLKNYGGEIVDNDHDPSKRQDSTSDDGNTVGNNNEEFFRPPSWHHQSSHRRSIKSPNTVHAPSKKVKNKSSSSSSSSDIINNNKLTWEELLTESFENIRDHYKEQYIILQNFWMHGTLTNLSHPSSSTTTTTNNNSQRGEEDLLVWSIFPWTWWGRTKGLEVKKKDEDSSSNNNKMNVLSQMMSGGIISKSKKKFSLYSIAMDVIDPRPYHHPSPEGMAEASTTADTTSRSGSGEDKRRTSFAGGGSLAEKILSSTPRLIAIANLLLALVYLVHAAIADLFLGSSSNNVTQSRRQQQDTTTQQGNTTTVDEQTRRQRRMGREKLGGYLLFKLLLISSVLDPGRDDLLILFSWYMVLSFLRSLTHLAGATANHASQSGQPPRPGTLRLLIAVFICDVVAATGCIVLFREAGWHLLLLLTCDCALVAADTMAHIVKYLGLTMEERHRSLMSSTEEELANLRRRDRTEQLEQYRDELQSAESEYVNNAQSNASTLPIRPEARLEREIEERELVHTRRMKIIDVTVFFFEMSTLILTMAHYLHIWCWHGANVGLVDFVLALHLHSTISIIGKKVAERRSAYRIGTQLSSHFKDATDLDIRKASSAGDVCCICLNSMALGNVKKVGCGHLFHTNCLREVVERERSIQVARCPLCRADLITGRHIVGGNSGTVGNNTANETGQEAQPNAQMQNNPQLNPVDTSLLRFSTEGWLPSWIPVPAFSFEVVRRETPAIVDRNPNPGGWQRFFRRGGQVEVNNNGEDDTDQAQVQVQEQQQQREEDQEGTSFWRRLLILLGFINMSPEEEAIAMEQLVDMFPQYERSDLLRELRARRSAEAVVESVLLGVFSGVARGG